LRSDRQPIQAASRVENDVLDQPRSATVRAVVPCDLLVLEGDDFRRIIADFPEAEAKLRQIANGRSEASRPGKGS
jgi:CRP-like cAMP-binding protein